MRNSHFYSTQPVLIFLVIFFINAVLLSAQTRQLITWQEDLNYLKGAAADELMANGDGIMQIRHNVELWIKLHPSSKIALESAPPKPWDYQEMQAEVSSLLQAVEAMLAGDSGRPFELGSTTVSVTAETSPLSPVADTFNNDEIVNRRAVNAATALDYLADSL